MSIESDEFDEREAARKWWLLVACGEDLRHKCQACRMAIDPLAAICPHCRTALRTKYSELNAIKADAIDPNLKYYYVFAEQVEGPLPISILLDWMSEGKLHTESMVHKVGGTSWVKLRELMQGV